MAPGKGREGMNDRERLQMIKDDLRLFDKYIGHVDIDVTEETISDLYWLISQVEHLQKENERLNTLLDQSRAGKLAVSRRLEFAEEEIDRLKADIEEALELLKRGGTGTRSRVQRLLEEALEGEK